MSTPNKPGFTPSRTAFKTPSAKGRSWLYRTRNALAGLLGLGLVAAVSPASVQAGVQQHWIAYAQLASAQLQGWLGDESNESVKRLQLWGQQHLSSSDAAAVENAVIVQLWVDASGQVARVEFSSLGDAQADADLRQVLTAQAISEPPPKDMMQPMRLGLTIALPEPMSAEALIN